MSASLRILRRLPTILLIRHGQASYGAAVYDELSPHGRRQAAAARDELARRALSVARIVSGSLVRQRDTAAPTVTALGLPLTVDPRLDEYDMDDILATHAATSARANAAPGAPPVSSREFQSLLEDGMTAWIAAGDASPAAQTWPQFARRTQAALTDLADGLPSGSTALVFTSAGVIAALCTTILGLPAPTVIALNRVSVNAGMTKLASGRSGLSVVSFNEHAYLERGASSLVTLR